MSELIGKGNYRVHELLGVAALLAVLFGVQFGERALWSFTSMPNPLRSNGQAK
jgi:hypothetical protein